MTTTIQLKRGISTDWTTNNPVLAAGEVGIETDTNKIKIGNGSTAWTSLEYFSGNSGSGTSNYNELTNQPQINSVTLVGNKSLEDLGLMSNANFLPDGYTINLKADGTGDFETIQDAIDSLNGKVCPGTVSIELAAGTYSISNSVTVDTTKFNISVLSIVGNGIDSTIISKSIVGSLFYITNTRTTVSISALTLQGPGYTTYSSMACIQITNAYAKLQNIKVANSSDNLVACTQNSRIVLQGTLYFEYSYSRGIYVTDSSILSQQGAVVANVNTMGTFAGIVRSSIISLPNITVNATNVPNIFSKTKNTIDLNGYIISNA